MTLRQSLSAVAFLEILVATVAIAFTPSAAHGEDAIAADELRFKVTNPCLRGERWEVPKALDETEPYFSYYRDELHSYFAGSRAPVRGFAEALGLRRTASSEASKALAEYWMGRALYDAKLFHLAHAAFASVASRKPEPGTAPVQIAALECLSQMQSKTANFALPEAKLSSLMEYASSRSEKETLWFSGILGTLNQLSQEKKPASPDSTFFGGAGPYADFQKAILALHVLDYKTAITALQDFFALSRPARLDRFKDDAHLLLARAFYGAGDFTNATNQLKLVKKSSNQLAETLSELSWAYLMNGAYDEAIGTAMNLQTGGLRHTFTPEAPMVMAMAMNEICQYPQSVNAVNSFRKNYEKPFRWLDARMGKSPREREDLYPLAVAFLRKTPGVPDRVASQWVRSPIFLSHQEELNLFIDERKPSETMGKAGKLEQRRMGVEIKKMAAELIKKIRIAKANRKPGETGLPQKVLSDLSDLKRKMGQYRRLLAAAPVWRAALDHSVQQSAQKKTLLVREINVELERLSENMWVQLQEIAENNQLIEVEIYNGASQDIIWQNAHPDYKQIAKKLQNEQTGGGAAVWDWGRAPASDDEGGEIWEDELGSFKADLFDNCESKDKYLALKRLGGST